MFENYDKNATTNAIDKLGELLQECRQNNVFEGVTLSLVGVHSAAIDAAKGSYDGLVAFMDLSKQYMQHRQVKIEIDELTTPKKGKNNEG